MRRDQHGVYVCAAAGASPHMTWERAAVKNRLDSLK